MDLLQSILGAVLIYAGIGVAVICVLFALALLRLVPAAPSPNATALLVGIIAVVLGWGPLLVGVIWMVWTLGWRGFRHEVGRGWRFINRRRAA